MRVAEAATLTLEKHGVERLVGSGARTLGGVVVVVAAHGSRNQLANQAHLDLVDDLAARVDEPVVAAFLELAEPSIPAAIDAAVADGHLSVRVLPYFLHPGRHLVDDLPRLVAEARVRHPAAAVDLLDSFGADPRVLDLLEAQVRHGH